MPSNFIRVQQSRQVADSGVKSRADVAKKGATEWVELPSRDPELICSSELESNESVRQKQWLCSGFVKLLLLLMRQQPYNASTCLVCTTHYLLLYRLKSVCALNSIAQ